MKHTLDRGFRWFTVYEPAGLFSKLHLAFLNLKSKPAIFQRRPVQLRRVAFTDRLGFLAVSPPGENLAQVVGSIVMHRRTPSGVKSRLSAFTLLHGQIRTVVTKVFWGERPAAGCWQRDRSASRFYSSAGTSAVQTGLACYNQGSCCSSPHGSTQGVQMTESTSETRERSLQSVAGTSLFFALYFFIVWLLIDPRLVHHAIGFTIPYHTVSFTIGWSFFCECISRPSGLVDYGAGFLWSLFCFGWAGALIVTATAWGTCQAVDNLLRVNGQLTESVFRFAPPLVLLVIYGRYEHPLKTSLSLLVALSCSLFYLRCAPRGIVRWGVFVLVLCGVAYYIAGSGSLLFPVLIALYEPVINKRRTRGVLILLSALIVPWVVGSAFFDLPVSVVYGSFLLLDDQTGQWSWLIATQYLFFPAVLLGTAWNRRRSGRKRRGEARERRPGAKWKDWMAQFVWRRESRRGTQTIAVCLAAGVIAMTTLDKGSKLVLQVDYRCQQGNWADALESAARLPRLNSRAFAHQNIMLALHHTRKVGSEMFCFPQMKEREQYRVLSGYQHPVLYILECRVFLELGLVNLAEKCAYEALTLTGELPSVLRQLAVINVVKDQPETARVFLNALRKKPFHRKEAEAMLSRLEQDPRLEGDSFVRQVRRRMNRRDDASLNIRWEGLLLSLLEENPDNRAAFDFLMAYYLCANRPDKVVENVPLLPRFGYRDIPRHFQEAVLICATHNDGYLPVPRNQLQPETFRRAELFMKVLQRTHGRDESVQMSADLGLGDSYFLYYSLGVSGK